MSSPHILYLVPVTRRRVLQDSSVVRSTGVPSGIDTEIMVVASSVRSISIISAIEDFQATAEGSTVASLAIPSGIDINTFNPEAAIVTSIASTITVAQFAASDFNTVTSVSSILSGDVHSGASEDTATILSVAIPTAADIHANSIATTVTSVAAISAVEVIGFIAEASSVIGVAVEPSTDTAAFTDAAPEVITNVTSVAILSATDSVAWAPDSGTVISASSMSGVDIYAFGDSATVSGIFEYVTETSLALQTGTGIYPLNLATWPTVPFANQQISNNLLPEVSADAFIP